MPTRIKLFGDTQRADQYRFQAYRKHLADALMLRGFQGLPIYRHTARLPEGGMVEIVCHHNFNEIAIYMPPRPQPVQERPEMPGAGNLLILLGDEFVGYWFFLWDAYSNSQTGPIRTADKVEDIYFQFPPDREQDDLYVLSAPAGLNVGDFQKYDEDYFSEQMFGSHTEYEDLNDSFSVSYEHPTISDTRGYARIRQYTENDAVVDVTDEGEEDSDGNLICDKVVHVSGEEFNVEWPEGMIVEVNGLLKEIKSIESSTVLYIKDYFTSNLVTVSFNYEKYQDGQIAFLGIKDHIHSGLPDNFKIAEERVEEYVHRLMDRSLHEWSGFLRSQILVKNAPSYKGNDIYNLTDAKIAELQTFFYRLQLVRKYHCVRTPAVYWEDDLAYREAQDAIYVHSTPIGNLKLRRRLCQSINDQDSPVVIDDDNPAYKPWVYSTWEDENFLKDKHEQFNEDLFSDDEHRLLVFGRAGTKYKEKSTYFFPDTEGKYTDTGEPDFADANPVGNRTYESKYSSGYQLAFQLYTVSFVEWVGQPVEDYVTETDGTDQWDLKELVDCTFIAAGCGRLKPEEDDPNDMDCNSDFEEAICQLIDRALQDQRADDSIPEVNEHTHYRGQLHGYFYDLGISNVFNQLRSRDAERLKLLQLVNQARKDNGLEPVKYNWDLEKAAIRFTYDMVYDLHIGHVGDDDSEPLDRHGDAGVFVNAQVHTTEMENNSNLPRGGGENTGYYPDKSAETAFNAWMDSDDHRAQILNDSWNYGMMGADYRQGSDGYWYWAQEFAYNPNY